MKIVNPIYDIAFKYLMENNKLAKKILSVILDKDIVEVHLNQQETFFRNEIKGLKMFRLDFKATVKESDGSYKTVLIELQKSKNPIDIQRFRNYLASNYMTGNDQTNADGDNALVVSEPPNDYKPFYPMIAIYILGYNLDDLPYLAVSVNRDVIDLVSKKKIHVKSFFIEHLTHEAHIIQVSRLPEKRKTLLEKFLVLFNQKWCTYNGFIINLQEVPEEFEDVVTYLRLPLTDDSFQRSLFFEYEVDIIYSKEIKHLQRIKEEQAEKERALKQAERLRKQKQKERKLKEQIQKEKDQVLKEKDQVLREKDQVLREKDALNKKLAKQMKKHGASWEEIHVETGLNAADIEYFNTGNTK